MSADKGQDFLKQILDKNKDKAGNNRLLKKEEYDRIVTRLRILQEGIEKKSLEDLNNCKSYEVVDYSGTKVLQKKGTSLRVVPAEDIFEIILSAQNSTGHGGRDTMMKHLKGKFHNIVKEHICIFLALCETCQLKRSRVKKSIVVRPILSKEMNSRCQIDLIDMQSQPDTAYKFILNYQDHLTKFVRLAPLSTKTANEVAEVLLSIILVQGAPNILQSDNGREFANQVVTELCKMWPSCRIVHGKPRHSQSQGSVERANRDVEDKLACWMKENKTSSWSQGLPFVMFQKNNSHHSGIKCSPFEAMYGTAAKQGIFSLSNLPKSVLDKIQTEEELEQLLEVGEQELERDHDTDSEGDNGEAKATLTQALREPTSEANSNTPEVKEPSPNSEVSPRDPVAQCHLVLVTHNDQEAVSNREQENDNQLPPLCVSENNDGCEIAANRSANNASSTTLNAEQHCQTCNKSSGEISKCAECDAPIHLSDECSSAPELDNGRLCFVCDKKERTKEFRHQAREGLKRQADRMLSNTEKKMKQANLGDTVVVPIPDVDRGRADLRNIKAVVLKFDSGKDMYSLGTEHGRLASSYTRGQFTLCSQKFLEAVDVPDKQVTLREVSRMSSVGHGQGYQRCHRKGKCADKKCSCFKNNRLCNSKCHDSSSCCNKG